MKILSCQCEKENKKGEGFHILHLYWSFSSDITAMKDLIMLLLPVYLAVYGLYRVIPNHC